MQPHISNVINNEFSLLRVAIRQYLILLVLLLSPQEIFAINDKAVNGIAIDAARYIEKGCFDSLYQLFSPNVKQTISKVEFVEREQKAYSTAYKFLNVNIDTIITISKTSSKVLITSEEWAIPNNIVKKVKQKPEWDNWILVKKGFKIEWYVQLIDGTYYLSTKSPSTEGNTWPVSGRQKPVNSNKRMQ